jgi:hypothetical protein
MYDNFIGGTFHFWRKLIQSMFLEGRGYVVANCFKILKRVGAAVGWEIRH